MPYYNVTVTIKADDEKWAEQVVERGIDKQGFVVLDICTDRIKDDDIVEQLTAQDDEVERQHAYDTGADIDDGLTDDEK